MLFNSSESAFERCRSDLLRLHAICRSNHILLVVSPFRLLADAQRYTGFLDNVHLTIEGSLTVAKNYFNALLPVVEKQIVQAKIGASAK